MIDDLCVFLNTTNRYLSHFLIVKNNKIRNLALSYTGLSHHQDTSALNIQVTVCARLETRDERLGEEIFSNLSNSSVSVANTNYRTHTAGSSVESKSLSVLSNSELTYQCPCLGEEEYQHNQANLHLPVSPISLL